MKIAMPIVEGKLCNHFGHCQEFCFIEIDDKKQIKEKKSLTPPPHEPGVLPRWLAENQVSIVLAGGMGVKAQQLLKESGIEVITGVNSNLSIDETIASYLDGNLETGANACDH